MSVIDFRRHEHGASVARVRRTWTAYDIPPALVHGIALIRAAQPNICVFAQAGRLRLQVGPEQFALSEIARASGARAAWRASDFGGVLPSSPAGGVLFSHAYWTNQGEDFFRWLASRAQDPSGARERAPLDGGRGGGELRSM